VVADGIRGLIGHFGVPRYYSEANGILVAVELLDLQPVECTVDVLRALWCIYEEFIPPDRFPDTAIHWTDRVWGKLGGVDDWTRTDGRGSIDRHDRCS